jgi:predicted NBD/HSP70 family sugar kinase
VLNEELAAGPARSESVRAHNLGLVLRAVASASGPVSRASLATLTGLTRASVSGLVDALVAGALLRETGSPTRVGVGRPSTGLALDPSGAAGLGLELNVDHVAACVVDLTGAVRVRRTTTVTREPLAELASLAGAVLQEAASRGVRPSGVALAVPGLVDPATGLLLVAPNLDRPGGNDAPRDLSASLADGSALQPGTRTNRRAALTGYAPRAGAAPAPAPDGAPDGVVGGAVGVAGAVGWSGRRDLHEILGALPGLEGVPLAIENEATLAARAEQRALGAAAPRSFLQLSGEVGIGAGLVLDGRLYRGRHGWSGELGHVTVWPGGRSCGCGSDGCLEQYAGQRAILRTAAADPSAGGIAERAAAGEPGMLAALAEAGQALGIALAGALNLLDLDAVVLGGLHASLAPWLVAPIETELDRRMIGSPLSRPEVRASALGGDAAVLGAAWSVLDRVLDDPASWLTRVRL